MNNADSDLRKYIFSTESNFYKVSLETLNIYKRISVFEDLL